VTQLFPLCISSRLKPSRNTAATEHAQIEMEPSTDYNRSMLRKRKRTDYEPDTRTNQRPTCLIPSATISSIASGSNHNLRYGGLRNHDARAERFSNYEIGHLYADRVERYPVALSGGPIGLGLSDSTINWTINEPYRNRQGPLQQQNIWRGQGNTMWDQGYRLPGPNRRTVDEPEFSDGVWNQEPRDRALGSRSRFPQVQVGLGGQVDDVSNARDRGGDPTNYQSLPVDRHLETESRVYAPTSLAKLQSNFA
jgi:hypothetical protein